MAPKRRAPSLSEEPKQTAKRARFAEPEISHNVGETNGPSGSKKTSQTQFGAGDSDEDTGFSNEVEANLDMGEKSRMRKGGIKVDGYDSDSTDDGEGVVLSRRKDKGDGEDEDEDMFAVGEKDEEEKVGKKEVKYLKLGDIEGQEFDDRERGKDGRSGSLDDDEASVSSSEPEDMDDEERRKKAGMGYEISKFNMKEEMEEGKFAEDGMYVRSYDAGAAHDRWLEDVGESEMKKARRAKRKADKKERERIKEEETSGKRGANGPKSVPEMECELLQLLRPHEDVLEALARLGKQKKHKTKPAKGQDVGMVKEKSDKDTSDIDRITALASALMVHDPDVYSTTYEGLLRNVRCSGIVSEDWMPPIPKYEYRWAVADPTTLTGNETTYGPFSAEEMKTWSDAMFFGIGGEKIKVRKAGESDWHSWDEVFTT